jgi:hypothetical protein
MTSSSARDLDLDVESRLEQRLSNVFHVKCPLSECGENERRTIICNVLYAYDNTWKIESADVVMGNNAKWWKTGKEEEEDDVDVATATMAITGTDGKETAKLKK